MRTACFPSSGGGVSAHPRMQTPQRQTLLSPGCRPPLVMSPVKHAEKQTPSPPYEQNDRRV